MVTKSNKGGEEDTRYLDTQAPLSMFAFFSFNYRLWKLVMGIV